MALQRSSEFPYDADARAVESAFATYQVGAGCKVMEALTRAVQAHLMMISLRRSLPTLLMMGEIAKHGWLKAQK